MPGDLAKDLIVILNDNDMSIAPPRRDERAISRARL
jgi:deoxyxylulose-5-phosphate synthase